MDEIKCQFKNDYKLLMHQLKTETCSKNDLQTFYVRWNPLFKNYGHYDVTIASVIGIAAVVFQRLLKESGADDWKEIANTF